MEYIYSLYDKVLNESHDKIYNEIYNGAYNRVYNEVYDEKQDGVHNVVCYRSISRALTIL